MQSAAVATEVEQDNPLVEGLERLPVRPTEVCPFARPKARPNAQKYQQTGRGCPRSVRLAPSPGRARRAGTRPPRRRATCLPRAGPS